MFGLRKHPDHAGPGPMGQGTRADIAQGTGLPKDAPTETQFGGTTQVPNTITEVNRPGEWPHNQARNITPGAQSGSREFVLDTRFEVQAQPPPARILRQLFERVFGFTSGSSGDSPGNGFPYNAEWGMIPHQYVERNPQGAGPYRKMVDDNAPIQAIFAGNPRQ